MTSDKLPRQRTDDVPDDCVIVGQVLGSFGLRGALRVRLETNFPERLVRGREFVIGDRRYHLHDARIQGTVATITLDEVEDRSAAEALRGAWLLTPKAELPALPAGEYYIHELVGLRVESPEGEQLGVLTDVLFTGANEVYVVRTPHGLLYLPAVEDVVRKVDIKEGLLVADPPEGSLPTPRSAKNQRPTRSRRRSRSKAPSSETKL